MKNCTTREMRLLLMSSAIMLALPAIATPAFAQAAGDGKGQVADGDIVVTAQRREQSVKDVPQSVSVVTAQNLESRDISNVQDLAFAVPGLSVFESAAGRQQITIRGIASQRGTSSLTGVYLDDTPLTGAQDGFVPSNIDLRIIDLERVEVLKGPQGTLFGEGAAGGVVRYITKDPVLNTLGGSISGNFYDTRDGDFSSELTGIFNVPIIEDVLGVRIAGTYQKLGGWIDNVGTGEANINHQEVKHIRLKALFKPTPELSIRAMAVIHRNDVGASNVVNIRPFDQSNFRQAYTINEPTAYFDNYNIYNLAVSYDFGFATLLSSTSRFEADSLVTLTQFVEGPTRPRTEILLPGYLQESSTNYQEVRLASNGSGRFKWVIGGSYKESKLDSNNSSGGLLARLDLGLPEPIEIAVPGNDLINDDKSRAWAGFADASYTFFDRLELGGGVRYFKDERSAIDIGDPTLNGTFEKWTYRVYGKFAVTDDLNIYANRGTGFRSGGFNAAGQVAAGAVPFFQPEDTVFNEVGLKSSFFDGKLGLDLAYFWGEYADQLQDVQRLIEDGEDAGEFIQYTDNVGTAKVKGFEWTLTAVPVSNFRLSLYGDILDTRFSEVSPLAPVRVGDPLDHVPRYSINVAADYSFAWSDAVIGNLFFALNHKGKSTVTIRNYPFNPNDQEDSRELTFIQLGIGATWNGFDIQLFARNLLDERDPINAHLSGQYAQARPRSIGFSISKDF